MGDGNSRNGKRTNVNSLLRVGLLDHTDGRIGYKNEKNNKGFHECTPPACPFRIFEESEDEGDDSGGEKDEDQLVLELFEDELPKRRWRVFRQFCKLVRAPRV